jgi:transcriptional regulator with XRE-family HTH domain
MRSQEKVAARTRLAELIVVRMHELAISIKDLASALDISYEHGRRIVRGDGVPSESTLVSICEALEIDLKQARRFATLDQIRNKYGNDILAELTGKRPALDPIEQAWDLLTPEQQQDAIAMIQAWANRNNGMNGRPTATPHFAPTVRMGGNFNKIKEWLDPKLERMGISVEQFARRCGLSRASIYFYCRDITRPDVQSMAKMCEVLGVSLEEGLAQFSARPNGRPKGA